ncbi:MAG: 3'(2'),5'-bisphosphate nucleotidase CysQ [Acidimicrobiia bacterium]
MPATAADHERAAAIATGAGELLLEVRAQLESAGTDPRAVKDAGDRASHNYIVQALDEQFPDDAVLSEEGADDQARLTAARVWIVDPLDGTREFSEPGRADWAVHVALVEGGQVIAAAVALPVLGITFTDVPPPEPSPPVGDRRPRMVVSRSRPPAMTGPLRAGLDAELVPLGSAGAKTMAVVVGEVDVYAHHGGQYEWDSAAPVGVAAAAGLHVSRLDGSPLEYNRPDPWLPDLLVCKPELAARVLEIVHQYL